MYAKSSQDFAFLDHWAHKRLKKPMPVHEA